MVLRAALVAADARLLLSRTLDAQATDLPRPPIELIAAGKAADAMAAEFGTRYGAGVGSGLVVGTGAHPLPDEASAAAGRRALEMARAIPASGSLVVLLSGGASALLAAPAEAVPLDDKREAIRRLLEAGADIHALNIVRKHLSAIKGGWLAASCPGRTFTFAISDVTDNDPATIASGPTVPDPTRYDDALDVLRRCGVIESVPRTVRRRLEAGARGEVAETPKPGDPRLARSTYQLVGSAADAVEGARAAAVALGYNAAVIPDRVVGEARMAASALLDRAVHELSRLRRPACVISSGETTVRVVGPGRGGRNQELALAAAHAIARLGRAAVLASVGTDGIDGPTSAAGAMIDTATLVRAQEVGLGDPGAYLAANDSYRFFAALEDLIITGPTGTNVGDLQIMLVA